MNAPRRVRHAPLMAFALGALFSAGLLAAWGVMSLADVVRGLLPGSTEGEM